MCAPPSGASAVSEDSGRTRPPPPPPLPLSISGSVAVPLMGSPWARTLMASCTSSWTSWSPSSRTACRPGVAAVRVSVFPSTFLDYKVGGWVDPPRGKGDIKIGSTHFRVFSFFRPHRPGPGPEPQEVHEGDRQGARGVRRGMHPGPRRPSQQPSRPFHCERKRATIRRHDPIYLKHGAFDVMKRTEASIFGRTSLIFVGPFLWGMPRVMSAMLIRHEPNCIHFKKPVRALFSLFLKHFIMKL